jgi:LysR family transcriptional regulator, benzoate and cis,cis-muconate-responsive activator of ben and cat genes
MNNATSLRQMRYFVAVAEELSFRRAAERLHITQPPLSRQVAELEATLGVVLLRRDSQGVQLTAAGAQALQEFRALLAQADAALARVAALRDTLPRLRLGWLSWLDMDRLPAFEQRLQRQGLVAAVESHLLPSHEAVAAVRAGKMDAALVAAPIESQGLASSTLARLRLAALVPSQSVLAQRRVVSLRELNTVPPFHRFRRAISPLLYDHFDRQYREHGFVPQEEAAAPEVMGVLARIGAGQGCTCMPMPLAVRRYAGVTRRALRERVTMDLALVSSRSLAPALRAAVEEAALALVPPGAELA